MQTTRLLMKTVKVYFNGARQISLGSSLSMWAKIFRKTNISNSLIRTFLTPWYAYQELEILGFRKILHTYLMDDPILSYYNVQRFIMCINFYFYFTQQTLTC